MEEGIIEGDDQWVDHLDSYEEEGTLRIGAINCNGLPEKNGESKNKNIKQCLLGWNLDICGMSEVNRHWEKVNHYY